MNGGSTSASVPAVSYTHLRDMETIVETLSDYGLQVKDTDMLTEYVRQALKRTISHLSLIHI